ncbi:MAG: ElyC/SanA/YdcF family protein, partial [Bacteroidota bacterium]
MKKWKRWQKWLLIAAGSGLIGIFLADILTQLSTKDRVYTATAAIPHRKVGLLLGTSKRIADGRRNLFYFYRLEAAVELFKAGKIDVILASGDNSTKYYDEPSDMKADLVKKGIPANRIYLDYAGFRTLDSVVRSKVV